MAANGNSGNYLRGLDEAQIVDREGPMQGIMGPGAIFGRIKPSNNASRPGGECSAPTNSHLPIAT
ncbi:MAG: hypothetical protein AAF514_15440 [Verrucomicrobiota bacterium]